MNDNYDWDSASKRRATELFIMLNFTVGSALVEISSERASNKDPFLQLSEVTKAGVYYKMRIIIT